MLAYVRPLMFPRALAACNTLWRLDIDSNEALNGNQGDQGIRESRPEAVKGRSKSRSEARICTVGLQMDVKINTIGVE